MGYGPLAHFKAHHNFGLGLTLLYQLSYQIISMRQEAKLPSTLLAEPSTFQGRRRLFESGTAIERRRRAPSAEGTSGGGGAREGYDPLSLGGLMDLPHENFVIKDD